MRVRFRRAVFCLLICTAILVGVKKAFRKEENHEINTTISTISKKFPHNVTWDNWCPVDDAGSAYVFSAYWDGWAHGDSREVTVIGISSTRSLICKLWYLDNDGTEGNLIVVKATVRYLHGSSHRFTSVKINCPLEAEKVPTGVTILSDKSATSKYALGVTSIRKSAYRRRLTHCVTPLNFRYGRAYELVEWIELNRLLGAEKFVFYNYSSAMNVRKVLDKYRDEGLVDIVQWPVPVRVDTWPKSTERSHVPYFGQIAQINDCLLRNKEASEFIVNTDLDEFLVPHASNISNLTSFVDSLPRSGAYVFRHSFFRKEWHDETNNFFGKDIAERFRLVTLLKTIKEMKVYPNRNRSKYIARTAASTDLLVHELRLLPGHTLHVVNPNKGLLHHYRIWFNETGIKMTQDRTVITKYKDKLIKRVEERWKTLPHVEMDIPI